MLPLSTTLLATLNLAIASLICTTVTLVLTRTCKSLPKQHAVLVLGLAASLLSPAAVVIASVFMLGALPFMGLPLVDNKPQRAAPAELASGLPTQNLPEIETLKTDPLANPLPGPTPLAQLAVDTSASASNGSYPSDETGAARIEQSASKPIFKTSSSWHVTGIGLVVLWVLGSTVIALRYIRVTLRCRQLLQTCTAVEDKRILWAFDLASDQVSMKRGVRLLNSHGLPAPMVVGIFRPAILVPVETKQLFTPGQLQAVLVHELSHIARRDHWIVGMQSLAHVLYWWNPLVQTASRQLAQLREMICDDIAARQTSEPRDYAASILNMAERVLSAQQSLRPLGLGMSSKSELECRIERIVDQSEPVEVKLSHPFRFALAFVGLVLFTGVLFSQVPQPLLAPNLLAQQPGIKEAKSQRLLSSWNQLGGSPSRNSLVHGVSLPLRWNVKGDENIRWSFGLGTETFSSPVVANGRLYIGTNNDSGFDKKYPSALDRGCLLCIDEATRDLLWQYSSEKLHSTHRHDQPLRGIGSCPIVEDERVWLMNNRAEIVCLDADGFSDQRNDGPFQEEESEEALEADVIWKVDLIDELGISPHFYGESSPTLVGDVLLVNTPHSLDADLDLARFPPDYQPPSFIALDKNSGQVLWQDASPSLFLLRGQWSSPAYAEVGGRKQAIFAGGDGWVYSFDIDGDGNDGSRLLWKFDCNPKESQWELGNGDTRNNILATPVVHNGLVYIAVGQQPEQGEGPGHLWCIDTRGSGDVSPTLHVDANDIPVARTRLAGVPVATREIANPNSAMIWTYGKTGDAFERNMHRCIGGATIADALLFVADFSGIAHCLDANTGELLWTHDLFAASYATPLVADGQVFFASEDGNIEVFEAARIKKQLATNKMGGQVYASPVATNNTLFVARRDRIFAIGTND